MRRLSSQVCHDKDGPGNEWFWACSLDPGHKGNHKAYENHDREAEDKLRATWPNTAAPAPEADPPPERVEALAKDMCRSDHVRWGHVPEVVQDIMRRYELGLSDSVNYRSRAAFALRWVAEHAESDPISDLLREKASAADTLKADRDTLRRLIREYRDARRLAEEASAAFHDGTLDSDDVDKEEAARKAARRALFAAVKESP